MGRYMRSMKVSSQYKIYHVHGFDRKMIEEYVRLNRNVTNNMKITAVIRIYDQYINRKHTIRQRYEVYHLLQYIILSTY